VLDPPAADHRPAAAAAVVASFNKLMDARISATRAAAVAVAMGDLFPEAE
jgi:hypothetical protein